MWDMRIECISIISFIKKKEKIIILVSKEVKTKWNGRLRKYYEDKGYVWTGTRSEFFVKVEDLSRCSEVYIDVKCDYCFTDKTIMYRDYYKSINNPYVKKYCCNNCKEIKIKECNLLKYGVENPMSIKELHDKQSALYRADINIVKRDFLKMGFILLEENYKNNRTKMPCKCINHQDIIQYKNYDSIKQHEGCSLCNASKGEKEIRNFLINNNYTYKPQYTIDKVIGTGGRLLRFDFVVYLNDNFILLIEYDGLQHFEAVDFASKGKQWAEEQFELIKIKDKIKNEYCIENNIPLLRIPYWDFDRIEEILQAEFQKCTLTIN